MKEEKDAICILQDNVIPNNVKLAQGNFICSVKLTSDEYNNTDFDSIRISPENEEINGINDLDEVLYNPKKTDEAIQKIKEKNIPVFLVLFVFHKALAGHAQKGLY